jgi:hypothetical protein
MSDEGDPGSPGYGPPPSEYGENQQPPDHGQQPPGYGQQPPGYGQQPPDYGRQPGFGQPPGYPDPQYPPGQYPTQQLPPVQDPGAQYPGAQYPGAQYPGAQYPGAQYPPGAAPPPYSPYQQAQPGDGAGRGRTWIAVAVVALLVAAGLGAFFLFSGSNADAGTPKAAVSTLLDAGKTGDVNAAKKALCKAAANDNTLIDGLRSSGRITRYTIESVRTVDSSHAVVSVKLATTQISQPVDATFPAVKEDGSWKACPTLSASSSGGGSGTASSVPSASNPAPSFPVPSISVPAGLPSSLPSFPAGIPSNLNNLNPCSFSGGSVEQAATTYVGLAELGQVDYAQGCVYHDAVPRSVTVGLHATTSSGYYAPTGTHGTTVEFTSIDSKSHVEVTMTKESDGTYYVTKVEKG